MLVSVGVRVVRVVSRERLVHPPLAALHFVRIFLSLEFVLFELVF